MSRGVRDYAAERARMVAQQIEGRGIRNAAILAAMNEVPRHCFVDEPYVDYAYSDSPLPIPAGQTISQPYVVALMLDALDPQPSDRVLEVGTGSGYAAALLGYVVAAVYTIERHRKLVEYARQRIQSLGYRNVHVIHGDGTLGSPEHAPFDGIVVAAGGPAVPETLCEQLAIGGRLIIPVGRKRRRQHLLCVIRRDERDYRERQLGPVAFVPLIGKKGWTN